MQNGKRQHSNPGIPICLLLFFQPQISQGMLRLFFRRLNWKVAKKRENEFCENELTRVYTKLEKLTAPNLQKNISRF